MRGPPEPVADIPPKKNIAKKTTSKKRSREVPLPTAVAQPVKAPVFFAVTNMVRTPGIYIDSIVDMKTHDGPQRITQMVDAVITAYFEEGSNVMLLNEIPMISDIRLNSAEIADEVFQLHTRLEHEQSVGILPSNVRLHKDHRPGLNTLVDWLLNRI